MSFYTPDRSNGHSAFAVFFVRLSKYDAVSFLPYSFGADMSLVGYGYDFFTLSLSLSLSLCFLSDSFGDEGGLYFIIILALKERICSCFSRLLHGPSMFAVKAKIYRVLYN